MNLTAPILATITASPVVVVEKYAGLLNAAMEHFDINTDKRVAAFLGQLTHESTHFSRVEEALGYSAKRLMQVWPSRFPTLASTKGFAYNPKALANKVYGGRMGNGKDNDDGWRYRGRGLIQLTGYANYKAAQDGLGMRLTGADADRVALPEGASWTAGWYWHSRKINPVADVWNLEQVTIRINGGLIGHEDGDDVGLNDRVEICNYALEQTRRFAGELFNL